MKCADGSAWLFNVTHFYLSAVIGCRTGIGIVCASYCNEVMLLIYREIYWRKMNVSHKQNRRGSVSLEQISMHNERPTFEHLGLFRRGGIRHVSP